MIGYSFFNSSKTMRYLVLLSPLLVLRVSKCALISPTSKMNADNSPFLDESLGVKESVRGRLLVK